MKRTRVKICGISSTKDARLVVDAGADAIGLVFYEPSPRYVDIERAVEIASVIPPFVSIVALFVNASAEQVNAVLNHVPISLLQFHGDESPAYCEQFQRPYIKALRMKPNVDVAAVCCEYWSAQGILLDAYRKGVPGGTGECFDWQAIPRSLSKPIVLAGGLQPANIAAAIAAVEPVAVDVSGGVEASAGVKDSQRVIEFINQVNLADMAEHKQ